MTKYSQYQDYVIRDGRLIGEFEEMYRDFDDPWEQGTREAPLSHRAAILFLCRKHGFKRILEIGCGHGHFTHEFALQGARAFGVDVSATAIAKASELYPECTFMQGDILDFEIYREIKPDCIFLAEVTWYILEKLDRFLEFYKKWGGGTYLLHALAVYPKGEQKYGAGYFTDLDGILSYFGLDYEEYGAITYKKLNYCTRTYFLGKPAIT